MIRNGRVGVVMAVALSCLAWTAGAQERPDASLRAEIERRFDVLPLRDGLALRPKRPDAGVRSIEIAGGAIALDGAAATGAELRARLGADADAVIRLSYLTDADRRALFGTPAPGAAAAPAPPPPPPDVAPPPPPPPPAPPRPPRERRNGDRVRVGGSVSVAEGETIEGDVVAVGGSVRVEGEVLGDVVAVGGGVVLGPHADVDGNVVVVGGRLERDPGARVGGKAQEVGFAGIDFGDWTWRRNPVGAWWRSMLGSAFALVGTLARVGVLCLLAALVILFGRDYMERAGSVAQAASVKAGLVGLLAQLLFIPILVITIVVLVMTIVGIPLLLLLPFAILAAVVVGVVGFTAVANRVGLLTTRRLGWREDNPYAVTITGVLVLMLPVILSRLIGLGGGILFPMTMGLGILGAIVEYLAWTVGFGAVALSRFNRRETSVLA